MVREFTSEQQRARTLLAQLEMVSHGTTQSFGGDGRGGDKVRLLPPGGVAFKDDREDPNIKSHVYYRRRLDRCQTEQEYGNLADDIETTLKAWRVAARPPRDSSAWREKVGKTEGSVREVARVWGISPSYAHQLIQQHKRKQAA